VTAAIALSDLVFRYGRGNFILSCPHLPFAQGELSLITGPNGSGKTTLSKLMCGILRPAQGEVRLFGRSAATLSLGEIGGQIGYLFQDPSRQLFAGTVWKEMTFASDLLGEEQTSSAEKALELLERFGLAALKERSVYYLSGGEKQRLAICTILMGGAKFLILDEPTVGLDRKNREILYGILDDLLAEGRGLAVITHENELIERFSRARLIKLENGQVTP
jgi:energy-coupling factor transport system ATP-binding protein